MVCMSTSATSDIIDKVADDYDVEVLFWGDKLKDVIKVS